MQTGWEGGKTKRHVGGDSNSKEVINRHFFEREEEKKQGAATHPWKEVGVRTAEPSMRQTISPRGGIVSLPLLRHASRCAKTDVMFRWNTKYIFSFASYVSATVTLLPPPDV